MKTFYQIKLELREMGVSISDRSFWQWVDKGLVQGEKRRGAGNVLYFADDTPHRIVRLKIRQALTGELSGKNLDRVWRQLVKVVKDAT